MDLVAKKAFRIGNRGRVAKGERFSVDPVVGRVYVAIGHAEHPPRVVAPAPVPAPAKAPEPAPAPEQTYQHRMMSAEALEASGMRRVRRGRPRKNPATTEE